MSGSGPRLADVAARAGVSTATVSRCLNSPASVRPETRARVEAVIEDLGYTPHFGGRALVTSRTSIVGTVIPTMENAIFARGLQALQEALAEAEVTLLVSSSGYDPAREEAQIRALIGRGVDGLVLIGVARPERVRDFLARRRVPVVIAWSYRPEAGLCAGFDNRAAAAAMAGAVLAEGHREVAMIAGIAAGNDRAADRLAGVRDRLAQAGLALPPGRVVEAPYTLEAGAAGFARLMALDPRPTAVLCGNDVLAVGALLAARRMGIAVPAEVSVTGFDDIELASVVEPGLTTVAVPHRRMGEAAARLLLAAREGAEGLESLLLPTAITRRASLGPAPG